MLTFNLFPRSCFWFFVKTVVLKIVNHLIIYQHTQFEGPALTGAGFASTSRVSPFVIFEWLKMRD